MKQTIFIAIFFSVFFVIMSRFFFWGDWYFIVYSLIPGITIPFYQNRDKSREFIPVIIMGSILYSSLSVLLVVLLFIVETGSIYSNWQTTIQAVLIYAVMCFIGGLFGVALKGSIRLSGR